MSSASTVVFACNPGFSLDGEKLNESLLNGQQELHCSKLPVGPNDFLASIEKLAPCVPIVCGLPVRVDHAHWRDETKLKQYGAGEEVEYRCDLNWGVKFSEKKNFFFTQNFKLKCTDSGWALPANCEPVTCSNDIQVANGALLFRPASPSEVGTKLNAKCNPGFSAIGFTNADILTLTCSQSGEFVPTNHHSDMCQQILCPALPETLLGGSKNSAVTSLGFGDAPVQYACRPEWGLPPITVSCKEDRTYDVIGRECAEPKCTPLLPAAIVNAIALGGLPTATLGTRQTVGCTPGFMAEDRALEFAVKCIGPGTWTPVNPIHATGCSVEIGEITAVALR